MLAISIIDPIIGSISNGLPAFISWVVDGLWFIIDIAPLILSSIETLNLIPIFSPTNWHSFINFLTRLINSLSFPIWSKVLFVKALTGLKEQFPHNLIHISFLKFFFWGTFNPPAINKSAIFFNLSDLVPSGSPSENFSPSLCLITPGSIISHAGYTTHPMAFCGLIVFHIFPAGSTLSRKVSSKFVPVFALWKYHHGKPFTVDIIEVCSPIIELSESTIFEIEWALTDMNI